MPNRDQPEPPGSGDPGVEGAAELARFVERFALDLTEAGFPRMPARVLVALLVTEDGTATASELGAALSISPAAVSGAIRHLLQLEMVTREREPGRRSDHYRVRDDIWYRSVERRDRAYERLEDTLLAGVAAAGAGSRAGVRLDETRRFFEFVRTETPGVMRRWFALRDDPGAQ